jgi:hypothetical protein
MIRLLRSYPSSPLPHSFIRRPHPPPVCISGRKSSTTALSLQHRKPHHEVVAVTVPHRPRIPVLSLSLKSCCINIMKDPINIVRGRRPRSFSSTSSSVSSQQQSQHNKDAATIESEATSTTTELESSKTTDTSSDDTSNRKKTTSSKNSYLVVKLEKNVLKTICDDVQSIQTKFLSAVEHPRQAVEKHYGKTNYTDKENQPLQLQLRNYESLELILFSGGVALNTVPPDVLQSFYDQVVDRLDRAGMALNSSLQLKDGNIAHPDDYWFRVNEFKLFPPTTKHLLVVTFDTSIAWMCLYEDIQLVANKFPELPHRPLEKNQILRWLPLIVIADVTGGTGRFVKEQTLLQNVVTHWSLDCTSTHQTICMGGTIPSQIMPPLDWNFHDKFRKRPENEADILASLDKGEEFWKVPPK